MSAGYLHHVAAVDARSQASLRPPALRHAALAGTHGAEVLARRLWSHGAVWGALVLAAAVNQFVVPSGTLLPLLYSVPLCIAVATWTPQLVAGLATLAVGTALAGGIAKGVPENIALVGLVAQGLVGTLAVYAAHLRQVNKAAVHARDDILLAVAHDVKNPLTAIRGRAQLLRRQIERQQAEQPQGHTDQHVGAGLAQIDAVAAQAVALLDEMLDAVRLDARQPLSLQAAPTDLVALADKVAARYQGTTDRHHITVVPDVPALMGTWDAFRLERVLENLLSNAIKYSPWGGDIVVEVGWAACSDAPGWAKLSVRDPGIGIPAAEVGRVFERFARATNATGRFVGTGIGLAGTRRIVEQHGGTLTVDSVEGVGSTFTVRLPVWPAHAWARAA